MFVDMTWLLQMILEWEIKALWFIDNAILLGPDSIHIGAGQELFQSDFPGRNHNPELTDMTQSFPAQTKQLLSMIHMRKFT